MEKQDTLLNSDDKLRGGPDDILVRLGKIGIEIKSRSDLDKILEKLEKLKTLYSLFPNERIHGFSAELLRIIAEKEKSEICLQENFDPLIEIPEPQMRLFGYTSPIGGTSFYGTEEELIEYLKNNKCDMLLGYVSIIEFMGNMAGALDVIRKTYRDGRQLFVRASGENSIRTYNPQESAYQRRYIWDSTSADLRDEYEAFKVRGVVLADDVYKRADERHAAFLELACKVPSPKYQLSEKIKQVIAENVGLSYEELKDIEPEKFAEYLEAKTGKKVTYDKRFWIDGIPLDDNHTVGKDTDRKLDAMAGKTFAIKSAFEKMFRK